MNFTDFEFTSHILDVLKSLGYAKPTQIQQQAIRPILDGKDLIGLAQTGTGKTAAFSLPLLQQLSETSSRGLVKSLILAPTRELANQTAGFINEFSKGLAIKCSEVYGGVSKTAQVKQLKNGVDIVVACPGRLLDLINCRAIDLSNVDSLVLDEVDQMFDKGFLPDLKRIIAKLPQARQNLVFSATMPKEVKVLVEQILDDPSRISVEHKKPNRNISHLFYTVNNQEKTNLLRSILDGRDITQAIVFTRTKYKARSLAFQLSKRGFKAASLQGNMSQNQRQKTLDGFKCGTYTVLVATDIAARGIDVAGISHVINYDMPDSTEMYTHRTGRTGRANRTGQAVTFASPENHTMLKCLEKILRGKVVSRPAGSISKDETGQAGMNFPQKNTKRKRNSAFTGRRGKSTHPKRAVAFNFGI